MSKCLICTGNVIRSSHGGKDTKYSSNYELCYKHYREVLKFKDSYLLNKDATSAWFQAISIIRDVYLATYNL